MKIQLKRVYEAAAAADGERILVDRLWPRGLTKDAAAFDHWLREVGPSNELRRWFGHDPAKWPQFRSRYRSELQHNPAFAQLRALVHGKHVTLVYSAKDEQHNQAVVLKELLEERG